MLAARRAGATSATSSALSGNARSGSSQPCSAASARNAATFARPISPQRLTSRSVSPARNCAST
ncbi:MAG: hypothetical protein ACK5YW_13800 [Betaproteobacteria bacterium]|nr:hypothetical protein [Rhodocyclaceae bacterium]MCA3142542.1 hypothetical protein [Rhodocyclaceae bacterium]MCA3144290.1 hypothetical protein [Rhodocyclaceae bacterium]